jgi:hypothetical protein
MRGKSIGELYKHVFDTPEGERVLEHICSVGFMTKPTLAKTHDETMMNEGMRRLALSILKAVKKSEKEMLEHIQKEYQQ